MQSLNRHQPVSSTPCFSSLLLGVALIAGIILRLRMYLQPRSLWLDTANLANNIVEKSYAGLWGLLDGNPSSPVGFLLSAKFFGIHFGYSELVLILLPFLFGVGALLLFLLLSIEVLGRSAAPLAFIPFTFCSTAIYYSGEFKQYSADLFFSVLILLVTHRILRNEFKETWILLFGIVGVISVWFSHAAIFMLSGTGIALFWNSLRYHCQAKKKVTLSLTGLIIFLHFLALYIFQIQSSAELNVFFNFWKMGFAPVVPFSYETLNWWITSFFGYAKYPLGFNGYAIYLSLAAFVFGLVVSLKKRSKRQVTLLLIFPIAILILFSILHLYPITTGKYDIYSRLVLFTVPVSFILIAIGLVEFSNLFAKSHIVAFVLGVLLVYSPIRVMTSWPHFMKQEMKPLVSYLYKEILPEDSVYVFCMAVPAFRFYSKTESIPFVRGTSRNPEELTDEIDKMPTGKRIWAILSHDYDGEYEIITRELESLNGPVVSKEYPGARLLLSVPRDGQK